MCVSPSGRDGRCAGVLLAVALPALAISVAVDAGDVRASCVAPALSLDHTSGAAGDVVEIRGQYFGTGCNDVEVDGTLGGPPLGEPQVGIELVIVQDDQVIPLGSIDADSNYEFAVRLAIPPQLRTGTATIRARAVTAGLRRGRAVHDHQCEYEHRLGVDDNRAPRKHIHADTHDRAKFSEAGSRLQPLVAVGVGRDRARFRRRFRRHRTLESSGAAAGSVTL